MTLRASAGFSNEQDATKAAQQATHQVLSHLDNQTPRMVIACATCQYDQSALVHSITTILGSTPLIGCVTSHVFSNQADPTDTGVVLLALYDEYMHATVAIKQGLRSKHTQVAEQVSTALEPLIPPYDHTEHAIALTLADGLNGAPYLDDVLQHVTTRFGPFCPIVGGAIGTINKNDNDGGGTLFTNDHVQDDSLAIALITTPSPVGIGVRHGWKRLSQRLLITRSEGNRIYQLDNRPALDVYREYVPHLPLSHENFIEYSVQYPLGFVLIDNELLLRVPVHAYYDGSIELLGTLPGNAVAYIMESQNGALLDATQRAALYAVQSLGNVPIAAAFVLICGTRAEVLKEYAATEMTMIRTIIGESTPMIGMYSLGEFAADSGPVHIHHNSVVVCAIGAYTTTHL